MEDKKIYSSLKEFIDEFKKGFSEVPEEIVNFWYSILFYCDASMDVGAEGNSGEFSREEEEKRLNKVLQEKEEILIDKFAQITGYRPILVENKIYPIYVQHGKKVIGESYMGAWDFKKID